MALIFENVEKRIELWSFFPTRGPHQMTMMDEFIFNTFKESKRMKEKEMQWRNVLNYSHATVENLWMRFLMRVNKILMLISCPNSIRVRDPWRKQ